MSSIHAMSSIGIAVFLESNGIDAFNDDILAKYTDSELANMSVNPEDYDPECPENVIYDMADAEVTEFYREHLNEDYPLLDIHSYGSCYGQVDGYAVFILSTHKFTTSPTRSLSYIGDLDVKEPTIESFDQLRKFKEKFVPTQEIDLKQWVSVC